MGRGRKGVIDQGHKKDYKSYTTLPKEDRRVFWTGIKTKEKQTSVYPLSEEVLNQLKKMNPRAVANILVNS